MTRVKSALIVGGGIAGPVTALALQKASIESTVFEAYPANAKPAGAGFLLAPNGLAALRIVGVDSAVHAIGQPIQRMVMEYGRGGQSGEFAGLPGLPSLMISRDDLQRVLRERMAETGIRVEHVKRIVGAEERGDGVTARFADGTTATADVLIGADGIRSTVRRLIDPDAPEPEYVGLLGFGGFAGVPGDGTAPGRPEAMHFAFGRRAFFGYWTAPDGRTAWFSNLPHERPLTMTEAGAVPAADWLRELRAVHAQDTPAGDLLRTARAEELITIGAMEILPKVPHWHRAGMVLVGDAAHAPSSSSGQGVSLAVESAVQLARCLRDRPDRSSAFLAYEALRRGRVEKIAENARKTNRQKAYGPVGSALMALLMPIATRTFLKPEKMFGPVHNYRIAWDENVAA